MEPRDVGFALAALTIDPQSAGALAERAPREAGASIQAILGSRSREQLAKYVADLEKDAAAGLAGIHPTWISARLLEAPQGVIDAVVRALEPAVYADVSTELRRFGRSVPPPGEPRPAFLQQRDAERIDQFRRASFPELLEPVSAPNDPITRWLQAVGQAELCAVAREIGLRVVSRAFCRIGREDLARLCQGLPPQDSVRLVSSILELNESLQPTELAETQATHLRLLRASGISQALFDDIGLAFLAAGGVSQLPTGARYALAYRFPDELGRRFLDLSAEGALPEATAVETYRKELGTWLEELREKGTVRAGAG